MSNLSPKQEREILAALITLNPAQTYETLKAGSISAISAIRQALGYSADEAEKLLDGFLDRRLIETTLTPGGGELHMEERMPESRWVWVRPVRPPTRPASPELSSNLLP